MGEAIEVNAMNFKSPRTLKRIMALLFRLVSKKLSFLWSAGAEMSHEGWVQNAHKDRLIYQLTSAWEDSGFDVLLCPAFAMPALPNALCSRLLPAASYTCVYNLVGCPAGIVPVTRESSEDQTGLSSYPGGSQCYHRGGGLPHRCAGCGKALPGGAGHPCHEGGGEAGQVRLTNIFDGNIFVMLTKK